jgi:hypothetical protein
MKLPVPPGHRLLLVLGIVLSVVSSSADQTAATGRVMREKLVHAQAILRSLMVSDLKLLETESTALAGLTREEGWRVLTTPEYLRQSSAFEQSVMDLVDAAKQKDLDAAAVSYTSMTMRCYQCHRYLKGVRRAGK